MPLFKSNRLDEMEREWDPDHLVTVRNTSAQNILLQLPAGNFRLDAGRTFRMTADITDVQQVKDLIAAGMVQVSKSS